jgi:hypothetical protein
VPLTGKDSDWKDFGSGRTYARTKRKYGKKKADKQREAVILSDRRKRKTTKARKRNG